MGRDQTGPQASRGHKEPKEAVLLGLQGTRAPREPADCQALKEPKEQGRLGLWDPRVSRVGSD